MLIKKDRRHTNKSKCTNHPLVAAVVVVVVVFSISSLTWHRIGLSTSPCPSIPNIVAGGIPSSPNQHVPLASNDTFAIKKDETSVEAPISSTPISLRANEPPTLGNCGVVFFYHIPDTGGTSIHLWLKQHTQPAFGNFSYFDKWGNEIAWKMLGQPLHPHPEQVEAQFQKGMEELIQNLKPGEWKMARAHYVSLYLNESEDFLNQWRSTVEGQGCRMINTVMMRDSLNHAMSLYKRSERNNVPRDEWVSHLSNPTVSGKWSTQLDFFLYNNAINRRNPYNVPKEEKVRRALEILERHFDIVAMADHEAFIGRLVKMTGWKDTKIPNTNGYGEVINFTKSEVQVLQNLLKDNGDLDFIDAVKMLYNRPLSYLKYFS